MKDDTLQKLRKIYIRNVFDFHIRLKEEEARREVCAALGLSDGDAKGILRQLECDASYLRLREVKEAMKPPAAADGRELSSGCTPYGRVKAGHDREEEDPGRYSLEKLDGPQAPDRMLRRYVDRCRFSRRVYQRRKNRTCDKADRRPFQSSP